MLGLYMNALPIRRARYRKRVCPDETTRVLKVSGRVLLGIEERALSLL